MRGRPAPDPADLAAFRAAVADVAPLVVTRVHHEPPPPPAIPRQSRLDARHVMDEALHGDDIVDLQLEGGDEAAFLREGLPQTLLRDLRRGRWSRQAKLDLHGLTRDAARPTVAKFLADCRRRELRCVRIIHGKGLSSPGREPVLKRLLLGWLVQRREVLAFCQARAAEGGAGAVIVLLAIR